MSVQTDFFSKVLPYAQTASKDLDIPVSVILAQWAHESAYGQSDLAKRSGNLAGIKHVASSVDGGRPATGMYADYGHDMSLFVQDYERVLKLSYYKSVRDAVSVDDTAKALGASPYAESKYGGGKSIMDVIRQFGLTQYDSQNISGDGAVIKQIPVEVPQGASQAMVGLAVIAAGLALIKAVVK